MIDGHTGYLNPLGGVDSMAAEVRKLAADLSLRAKLRAAAKARAERYFSPEASVGHRVRFYRQVLAEPTQ
jgi:glycosyltransferase involved in cell wall biosynthesis